MREQLRTEVLGKLEGDAYARSVLVAALGALSEISRRVAVQDAWCEPSVVRLRAAASGWSERLIGSTPACAARIGALVVRARSADSLADERSALLEAAEEILTALWALEPHTRDVGLMGEVRELVAADVELEISHLGKSR
ncbi:MAG: hypothetical protein ACREBE_03915 [bacterium]